MDNFDSSNSTDLLDELEKLALKSLIEYTGWERWATIGHDTKNGVTSFTFMRDPYFLGANFVVDVTHENSSARVYPGK